MPKMPKFKKSQPETIERFLAALPTDSAVVRKQMFGYPASFVNGNFFTGLFEDDVVARLPGGIKDRLAGLERAQGFNPMGKGAGMKDWWVIPPAISTNLPRLAELLANAFEEVRRLPAKAPAKAKRKAAGAK